jgi:flagellar basal-body rod modification protein FlgD
MEDFMALMTTQLQNQDPLKPMESGDFLGQIASFGTVSGIADLQNSFSSFARAMQSDQALQGSSLVGRSVLVPSSIGSMSADEPLKGQINVAAPVTDLKVQIYNEGGDLVKTIDMGGASGYTNFNWDGLNDDGEAMPSGIYQFRATGTVEGKNTAFATATVARVDSVLVGGGSQGLTVNLAGIGSVPFSEVQEII